MEQEVGVQRVVKRRKSGKEDTADRKYACGTCGKAFKHKHHRTEHERLHTGEKPYHCEWCGKRFAHSGSYSQHRNQAWCKNAEGRDREKKKSRGKSAEVEKKKTSNPKVLKSRPVEQMEANNPRTVVKTEAIKTEPSTKPYPALITQSSDQSYHHLPNNTSEQTYQVANQALQQSFQHVTNEAKEMTFQQIAKYFQTENGAQPVIPQEFLQSAEHNAWLIENAATVQNMLDIHLNSIPIPEQASSSNVQYLYTVPGDQTTYCLSGIPYVNKVAEVQGSGDGEQETTSGDDGSQSAYECYNIFNVQPTTEGDSSQGNDPKQGGSDFRIFNVQRKTEAENSLEAQVLESSTAVNNLLGYAAANSNDTDNQGSHESKPGDDDTASEENATQRHLQAYRTSFKKEIQTDMQSYNATIKTEDTTDQTTRGRHDTIKIMPALLPAVQTLVPNRLPEIIPFPITNVIQCVLCHEECADTNALVEHIKNKHYYQVAGQIPAANHSETLQEKMTS